MDARCSTRSKRNWWWWWDRPPEAWHGHVNLLLGLDLFHHRGNGGEVFSLLCLIEGGFSNLNASGMLGGLCEWTVLVRSIKSQ
jgi:hypothetical protein